MPRYIILQNWTDQGIKNLSDAPRRMSAARKAAEELQGKVEIFTTFGEYDLVAIAEFPTDESAMSWLLSLGKLGNVRSKTLKAFTESEASKVIEKLR